LWSALTDAELRICYTNGGIAYCMNYGKLTPEQRTTAIGLIANANTYMGYAVNHTVETLKKAGQLIDGGKIVDYKESRRLSARSFQDFWSDIPKLHKASAHNRGYSMFIRTFGSIVYTKSEICAWMSRKTIDTTRLSAVLAVFRMHKYFDKLVAFKKHLIENDIEVRMPRAKWNTCDDIISMWHYMRSIGAIIDIENSHAGKMTKAKSPPREAPYESKSDLDTAKCYKKQLLALTVLPQQDYEWKESQLSSPRPCRCHEDPCWCLDPREIKRRTFD